MKISQLLVCCLFKPECSKLKVFIRRPDIQYYHRKMRNIIAERSRYRFRQTHKYDSGGYSVYRHVSNSVGRALRAKCRIAAEKE